MFDTRKTLHDHRLLDVIKILAANGETGRLEIRAGTTEGAFLFKNGQLVDARVGHLTGFQAVNAVASVRDARFNFDPSVAPPLVSSITPNERVVLKQFFGIETFEPADVQDEPVYSDDDEVTIETRAIPVAALPDPVPEVAVPEVAMLETPSSRSFYRGGLVLAALVFILLVAGAVALRNKYRERQRAVTAAVAMTTEPTSPPVAEEVKTNVAEVKTNNKEVKPSKPEVKPNNPSPAVVQPVAARDLSGRWNIVNTVQKTSYQSFEKMKIGFDLSIDQNGKSFTGKGQKVSENGRSLPANSRTPIQVKGSINGDRVEATFFEDGTLRKTNGRFVWRIDKTGALTGTFITTAARSSGTSAARKS